MDKAFTGTKKMRKASKDNKAPKGPKANGDRIQGKQLTGKTKEKEDDR